MRYPTGFSSNKTFISADLGPLYGGLLGKRFNLPKGFSHDPRSFSPDIPPIMNIGKGNRAYVGICFRNGGI